jgi:hypothetical protein
MKKVNKEETEKRIKYRMEFAKRNPLIRKIIDLHISYIKSPDPKLMEEIQEWTIKGNKELNQISPPYLSSLHILAKYECGRMSKKEYESALMKEFSPSSILLLKSSGRLPRGSFLGFTKVPLNYGELEEEHPRDYSKPLTIDAVDWSTKTIPLIIKLDQKKESILRDIEYLLDLIYKEAKAPKIDLKRPKPHWDEFEKYLKVYDYRRDKSQQWSWVKIAREMFPKETHTDYRGKVIPHPSAIDKVRNYYRQAQKMVEEGEWMKI